MTASTAGDPVNGSQMYYEIQMRGITGPGQNASVLAAINLFRSSSSTAYR